MTTTILIIVNVFSALAIIGLTLMQQSKGDMGSAFGGGSSQSMFGSRGSANFLSRSTSVMCVVFFASSLALAYVYAQQSDSSSVIDSSVIEQTGQELVPTLDEGVPTVPGSINTPTIPTEADVPSIPVTATDAAEAVEQAIEDIEEAVEEVPTVPQ